jgi:transposase
MSHSSTRVMGMDVHTDSIAVAYVAQDHGAEVTSWGTFGTRQGDMAHRIRKMPSNAQPLLFVYEAGPCGYWLSRYLSKTGDDCWGVAPSLIPQKTRRPGHNRPQGRGAMGQTGPLGGAHGRLGPHSGR